MRTGLPASHAMSALPARYPAAFLRRAPRNEPRSGPTAVPPVAEAPTAAADLPAYEPPLAAATPAPLAAVLPRERRPPCQRQPESAELDLQDMDYRRSAQLFFRLLVEVLDRRRPPAHIRPLVSAPVAEMVAELVRKSRHRRGQGAASLARVHAKLVTSEAAETMCTYGRDGRVLAMAARFELQRGRRQQWACTSLTIV
jgi:hypothetical protein